LRKSVTPLLQLGDVDRTGLRAHLRQALGEGRLAVVQHVGEGAQAGLPAGQVAVQELQVAQMLECFLEGVVGQQGHQVGGVRHVGQPVHAREGVQAAAVVQRVLRQQTLHELARSDGGDGLVQALLLAVEHLHGRLIALERAGVGANFAHGIGHRNVGFQHRSVGDVAGGQLGPGHQGQLGVVQFCGRPAIAQQGLVGLRCVQAHALQGHPRLARLLVLQRREAQCHVGAVAQAAELLVGAGRLAHLVQQRGAAGQVTFVAPLDERHAQVEAGVQAHRGTGLHAVQHGGRSRVVLAPHVQLRLQQLAFVLQFALQRRADAVERFLCGGEQAALVADAGQKEPGAVAHRSRCVAFDQARKHVCGLLVQTVRQQHAAAQHLGFVVVRRHAGEVLRHHQPGNGAKETVLVEVEQRVAVVRRANDGRRETVLCDRKPHPADPESQPSHNSPHPRTHPRSAAGDRPIK